MSTRLLIRTAAVAAFLFFLAADGVQSQPPAQAKPPAVPGIGLDWTEDQIRRAVGAVRAGRTLTPKQWPNGARVAVAITFDVDNELLARNTPLPAPMSQGEYGATTGVPRILRLLDKHQIPASFYIPAVAAMLHPDMVPSIVKSGRHEIGVHGWIHENLPSLRDAATEERLLT